MYGYTGNKNISRSPVNYLTDIDNIIENNNWDYIPRHFNICLYFVREQIIQ